MPKFSKREKIAAEVIRLFVNKRIELGLSKNALAQRAGLSIGAIRFIEDGKRNPSFDTVQRIADALAVELWAVIREASGSIK